MSESSLMKFQALRTPTLLKRDFNKGFSLWKYTKFLRTPCFTDHLQWLPLTLSGFQSATLFKKRLRKKCFNVNFAKFLRISFDRTLLDDCFLCLSVNFEKFSEHLLYRAPMGNCLFHVHAAQFQPPDAVENNFASVFHKLFSQAFYTRTRST